MFCIFDTISKLQKRAVRIISHQTLLCHTMPMFKSLKLPKFLDIFKLELLAFAFKLAPHFFITTFH